MTNCSVMQSGLLSASEDGTARIWDLKTNKGIVLLKQTDNKEIQRAKFAETLAYPIVITAAGDSLNVFDLRKPSLILKAIEIGCNEELKTDSRNQDDINDISI